MTVLNTPEQIRAYAIRSLIAALKIEVNTGMKMTRGSLLKSARAQYGIKARTKVGAITELQAIYNDLMNLDRTEQ